MPAIGMDGVGSNTVGNELARANPSMLELKFLCSDFLEKKFELVRTPVLLTILAELSRAPPSMLACSGSLGSL